MLSENDIIILGCPRSGKTTLTNMIIKEEQDYQVISLDSLMIAIKQIFLELEINNKSKVSEMSKKIIPFLSIYLKNFKSNYCRFVKHMRHPLMLKGFIAILLFFCC